MWPLCSIEVEGRMSRDVLQQWKGESTPHQVPPILLHALLPRISPYSANFHANIRQFNGAFQVTSFGTTGLDVTEHGYMSIFIIHRAGSLVPLVSDRENRAAHKCSTSPSTLRTVLNLVRSLVLHSLTSLQPMTPSTTGGSLLNSLC